MSGNEGEAHVRKCKASGMNEVVTKPVLAEDLKNIVAKAFKGYLK